MEVPEVKRVRSFEKKNARLRKLLADAMLDKAALQMAEGFIDGCVWMLDVGLEMDGRV